jgi:hypothetical protein
VSNKGPGWIRAGLRTKRVWIWAQSVTKMRWLTSSSRRRCWERRTCPSATMLEPYTPTDTPPTSSPGGRWFCWRDDSPRRRYSPECVEGKFSEVGLPGYGVLRSSLLRSPPVQPRSSSYRTTLRPLWTQNRSLVTTIVARIRYERLRLPALIVPENFHAP